MAASGPPALTACPRTATGYTPSAAMSRRDAGVEAYAGVMQSMASESPAGCGVNAAPSMHG